MVCYPNHCRAVGRGSKVHAAVDDAGRPLRIDVTGAQTHDSKAFGAFLDWETAPLAIVADKAYGSAAIRQAISDEGAVAVIPSKSNAKVPIPHDPNIYAMRNLPLGILHCNTLPGSGREVLLPNERYATPDNSL